MQLQPTLDTKIEEFGLHQRLHTRLVICRAKTFRDIMEINPADWKGVNPKVVNALRRFQNQYRNIYRQLTGIGESAPGNTNTTPTSQAKAPISKNDERRFFVANNILNAYAQAGMLTSGGREASDLMREIIEAADAFMAEYEKDKYTPSTDKCANKDTSISTLHEEETPAYTPIKKYDATDSADNNDDLDDDLDDEDEEASAQEAATIEEMVPDIDKAIDEALEDDDNIDEILIEEAAPVVAAADEASKIEKQIPAQPMAKKGEKITLTDYHGRNKSAAKTFKVGDTVTVKSMRKQSNGAIIVKAIFNNKEITLDSRRYGWKVEEEGNKQPELNLLPEE